MKASAIALLFVGISSLAGCAVNAESPRDDDGSSSTAESAAAKNCALVLCAAVACEPGFVAKTSPGQCCPTCVRDNSLRKGDCACTGGAMSPSYCSQFGDPWTSKGDACVWPAQGGSGLTAEQCSAVGDKHYGDASGSDIYNLGITCSIVGTPDCQTKKCPTGQHCDVCRTLSGPAYVCLPDGATC